MQEARRAAEKAYDIPRVDDKVNRAVAAANKAANAARVAAVKAAQKRIPNNGDDLPLSVVWQWSQYMLAWSCFAMPSHHQLADITFSFPVGEATARPSGHGELATPESLPAAFKLAGEDQVFSHPFDTSLWCLLRCSRTTALRTFHCPRQLVEVSSRLLLPFLQCNTHPMLEIWWMYTPTSGDKNLCFFSLEHVQNLQVSRLLAVLVGETTRAAGHFCTLYLNERIKISWPWECLLLFCGWRVTVNLSVCLFTNGVFGLEDRDGMGPSCLQGV